MLYSFKFLDLVKFNVGVYFQFAVHAVWLSNSVSVSNLQ